MIKLEMLVVGLINNMTQDGFYAAERRFIRVLGAAAQGISIELRYYATRYIPDDNVHRPLQALWDDALDGLLVTGAEPAPVPVTQEPLWNDLTQVVQWAADNTTSVIWSCLAGHVAAYYLDGVERGWRPRKIFGVYESRPRTRHALLTGIDRGYNVPHSRWNDLPADELAAKGYTILSDAADAGVDRCVKTVGRSEFVFLQTHPEYGTSTLLREYRRDMERYRSGISSRPPTVPHDYLAPKDAAALNARCSSIDHWRDDQIGSWLDQVSINNTWNTAAVRFFRNWLLRLSESESRQSFPPHNAALDLAASPL